MERNEITIRIGGKESKIPYSSFNKIIRGTIDSIAKIAGVYGIPANKISWGIIDAKKTNPIDVTLSIASEPLDVDVPSEWVELVNSVEQTPLRPAALPIDALEIRKVIGEVLSDGIAFVEFYASTRNTRLSSKFVVNAEQIATAIEPDVVELKPRQVCESATGMLHDMITHFKHKIEFKLQNRITNELTKCDFSSEDLFLRAHSLLRKRVRVDGVFHRDAQGKIELINVQAIDEFIEVSAEDFNKYPPMRFEDDSLNALPSAEIIRRMRDEG